MTTSTSLNTSIELPEEGCYIVRFDDQDREDVVFVGCRARETALKYYESISWSWNAHLFVKIDSNSRDAEKQYPSLKGWSNPSESD